MSKRTGRQRRRFYRHEIQKRYGGLVGASLFVYSLLIFGVVLIMPFIPVGVRMKRHVPFAAREFIVLAETIWPAVIALVIGAVLMSVLMTKWLGGPLFRLEKTLQQLAAGDLGAQLRFRKSDARAMHRIADGYNQALLRVAEVLAAAHAGSSELHDALGAALEHAEASAADQELIEQLRAALRVSSALADEVGSYTLPEPPP